MIVIKFVVGWMYYWGLEISWVVSGLSSGSGVGFGWEGFDGEALVFDCFNCRFCIWGSFFSG